ncbi:MULTISPECIES: hypothetical protein [unclassified Microcoleus]|uniref:hypothetical protein n=1 Tax=unclassified Microcoleus TaxID=2642155 RepID=UPI001E10BB9A|nr:MULTISPECIES: hypothetical protein [unclassified Microcoleus]MCC3595780.1 hypothetical protein [Microcoleus sp. PH2017_26_ELK_O_A]MCC3620581.1 hypothetical protein [Microcoleus sp. PH2017_36_ELK_O_B]
MKITGKNGKPLYGAAREAVLRKQSRTNWHNEEETAILFQALDERIARMERRQSQAPLTLVAALIVGCLFGTVIKPDLAAIAAGAGAAGLVVSICRQ